MLNQNNIVGTNVSTAERNPRQVPHNLHAGIFMPNENSLLRSFNAILDGGYGRENPNKGVIPNTVPTQFVRCKPAVVALVEAIAVIQNSGITNATTGGCKMPHNNLTAIFNGAEIQIISQDGQQWLTSADIAAALGYVNTDAITRLYNRNKDEFDDSMTLTVKLTAKGQRRTVRVFNKRGAQMIGLFAKTKPAGAFRRWVLDTLEDAAAVPALPAPMPARTTVVTVIENGAAVSTKTFGASVVVLEKDELISTVRGMQKAVFKCSESVSHGVYSIEAMAAHHAAETRAAKD